LRSFLFQLFSSIPNTQYEKIVLIYARDGRGAIEICLLEKRALAKKRLGNTALARSARELWPVITSKGTIVPSAGQPFKSHENHVSCRALRSYNSPGVWARELFKPSTDSASPVVEIEKKFSFSVGIFWAERHKGGVFLATFTWPWVPTHWAIIMAQDLFGN